MFWPYCDWRKKSHSSRLLMQTKGTGLALHLKTDRNIIQIRNNILRIQLCMYVSNSDGWTSVLEFLCLIWNSILTFGGTLILMKYFIVNPPKYANVFKSENENNNSFVAYWIVISKHFMQNISISKMKNLQWKKYQIYSGSTG